MKKAKVILDRFLRPPKWVICTVPTASFAALIFVFASHQEESAVAYPIFLLSAYSLVILLAALPALAGRLTQLKASLCKRSRLLRKVSSTAFGRQYLNDQLFRSSASIYQGMTVNFLYMLFRFMTAAQRHYWRHHILYRYGDGGCHDGSVVENKKDGGIP